MHEDDIQLFLGSLTYRNKISYFSQIFSSQIPLENVFSIVRLLILFHVFITPWHMFCIKKNYLISSMSVVLFPSCTDTSWSRNICLKLYINPFSQKAKFYYLICFFARIFFFFVRKYIFCSQLWYKLYTTRHVVATAPCYCYRIEK